MIGLSPAATARVGHEVDREGVGPDLEVVEPPGSLDHGPHHLTAGRVAEGVHDPVVAVPPLPAEFEATVAFVEPRAPGDELTDPGRGLADDGVHHGLVTEAGSGDERVGDVVVEPILGIDDAGDAPLGPLARLAAQIVLGDHRD